MIKLDRKVEAFKELDSVIAEAEAAKDKRKYGKTADAARAEQEQLKSEIVFLTVEMGASASINGEEIAPERWGQPVPMQPGTFEIVVNTKTAGEERKTLTLKPGETATISPTPPKPKQVVAKPVDEEEAPTVTPTGEPGVSYETLTYVSAGVGLAGLTAFTINRSN